MDNYRNNNQNKNQNYYLTIAREGGRKPSKTQSLQRCKPLDSPSSYREVIEWREMNSGKARYQKETRNCIQ